MHFPHGFLLALLVGGLLNAAESAAQTAEVVIAPYAIVGSIEQTRVDIRIGESLFSGRLYGQADQVELDAGTDIPVGAFASGSLEPLASSTVALGDGERYLLLLSGDGEREPYRIMLVPDQTGVSQGVAHALLVNLAFLPTDQPATATRWLQDVVPEQNLVELGYAQVSQLELPLLDGLRADIAIRRSDDGAMLVDPRASAVSEERVILLLAGDANVTALQVDLIGSQATGTSSLELLELGPVEIQLVHGAAFVGTATVPGDAFLSADGGNVLRLGYATSSSPIILAEQGTHRFGVTSASEVDRAAFALLELEGNRRYWVVAKAFASQADPLVDPEPFVAIEMDAEPDPDLAKLTLSYVPSLSGFEGLDSVALREDSGSLRAELSEQNRRFEFASKESTVVDLKVGSLDGSRNLLDLSATQIDPGVQVSALVVGNGGSFPLSLVTNDPGLDSERLVDQAQSGLWAAVDRPNQGFSLSALPLEDRLVGSWFSYARQGGGQRWFIVDSCNSPAGDGNCRTPAHFDNQLARLTVYSASGGSFDGAPPQLSVDGTMQIEFPDCELATVTYNLVELGSGSFQIANLTPSEDCQRLSSARIKGNFSAR